MEDRRDDQPSASARRDAAWTDEDADMSARRDAHRGRQKGAPPHAEGQHGQKTHERFIDQLESGLHDETRAEAMERERQHGANYGKRRLVEDREQHDEAEKNSERRRSEE
jgi:hypothetical protein